MKRLLLAAAALAAIPIGSAAQAQYSGYNNYNGYNNGYGYDQRERYSDNYRDSRDQYNRDVYRYQRDRDRYEQQRDRYDRRQSNWMFRMGQRVPYNYSGWTSYYGIPQDYRYRIPRAYRGGDWRYVYRGNAIYVVDPTTMLVRDIIDLLR